MCHWPSFSLYMERPHPSHPQCAPLPSPVRLPGTAHEANIIDKKYNEFQCILCKDYTAKMKYITK